MIRNNQVLGRPLISYRDTKANIESLSGLVGGETAYATDTGEYGYYDAVAVAWVWIVVGGGAVWGGITGTLSDQTDLQNALNSKVDENASISGATKTKITYDSKGLVTAGSDLSASDIPNLDASKITTGNIAVARLGDVIFLYPFSSYTSVGSGISASPAFPYTCTLPTFTTYPVKWSQGVFLGATNDASNYWTLELYEAGTPTLLGSVSTQGLTANTFHILSDTTLALSSLTQGTHKYLYVRAVKTGAPSNLSAHGPAVEYKITT